MHIVNASDLIAPINSNPKKSIISGSPIKTSGNYQASSLELSKYSDELKQNLEECEHVMDSLR